MIGLPSQVFESGLDLNVESQTRSALCQGLRSVDISEVPARHQRQLARASQAAAAQAACRAGGTYRIEVTGGRTARWDDRGNPQQDGQGISNAANS